MTVEPEPVALNDITDVTRLLKANAFDRLLSPTEPCNCHGTYNCSGRSSLEDVEALPLADQVMLKKARIAELERQVEDVERLMAERAARAEPSGPPEEGEGYEEEPREGYGQQPRPGPGRSAQS